MKTQGALPTKGSRVWSIVCACTLLPFVAYAQRAPSVPDRPWESGRAENGLHAGPGNEMKLDPAHIYTLPEQNNPATREAWAFAKGRASQLGISQSDLYPTLVADALGATSKDGVLINETFALQSVGEYDLALSLSYTLLDFGERRGHVDESRDLLLAANFAFNQAHLELVSRVLAAFFRLHQAQGEDAASEANLTSARTVH